MLQLLVAALLLPTVYAKLNRYTPARTGLQIIDAPATLTAALTYPCEDKDGNCVGIAHSEALFGVPKYGSSIQAYLYEDNTDPSDPSETACADHKIKPDPSWASPFILIVNRGACHFTEKVRNAQRAGAMGVIVTDNVALASEPLSYCPDYTEPQYQDGADWVPCKTAAHGVNCKCGTDHSVDAILLTSAPTCSGGVVPVYQTTCTDKTVSPTGACWYCGAPAAGGGAAEYFPTSCFHGKSTTNCQRDNLLPFMADDGDGGDITIPSFIISDYNGALLKQAVRTQAAAAKASGSIVRRVQVRMAWDLKTRDRVEYELWTSCEDSNGAEFKRDFMETALKLIDAADFTPRYYIYDGHALRCDDTYNCGTQCLSHAGKSQGKYCGPDPNDDLASGVSGADVVEENLRQMCIWNVLSASVDAGADRKELMKWWCYVNDFGNKCFNQEAAMESSESFAKCADDIMVLHALDVAGVQKCIDDSWVNAGDGINSLLNQEISDAKDYGVLKLPEVVVNGVVLRGQTGYGAMEQNVATAICNGYTLGSRPSQCDGIINPEGELGQNGNAKVNFVASLGYVDQLGGPLSAAALPVSLLDRFRSTLAMKLGVSPQAFRIKLNAVQSTDNGVLVDVEVEHLKCSDDGASKTTAIVASLQKIANCQGEASTDAQVEAETGVGQTFYFHSATNHGQSNRQVQSIITAMSADESMCVVTKSEEEAAAEAEAAAAAAAANGGVGVGWIIVIAIFSSGIVFGAAFFVWRRKAKEQMRNEVKAILAEYMPLDDAPGGDLEGDGSRMLELGASSSSSVGLRI